MPDPFQPGPLTPSQSRAANDLAMRLAKLERYVEGLRGQPPELIPAAVTEVTDGKAGWKEQYWDADGARADKPGGMTGAADYGAATDPNGALAVEVGDKGHVRRTSYSADLGTEWEWIAGGGGGGSHVRVTSGTKTGGRYPAVRLTETGFDHTSWPTGETCYVWNLKTGVNLGLGQVYPVNRWNTDMFLGKLQGAVRECCDPPALPDAGCTACDWPASYCVTITLTNGACGDMPASWTFKVTGGETSGSYCGYYASSVFLDYFSTFNVSINFNNPANSVAGWGVGFFSGGCNIPCLMRVDSTTGINFVPGAYDCTAIDHTFTGFTLEATHCQGVYTELCQECIGQPFTVRVFNDPDGDCGAGSGGGGGGASCCPDDPVGSVLTGTFTVPSGTCTELNGATFSMTYSAGSGGWVGTLSLTGTDLTVYLNCVGGTWYVGFVNSGDHCAVTISGGGSAATATCSPFSVGFGGITCACCPGAALNFFVT